MTDWVSAGGMILSGLIVGFMFWYGMKGRASKPDLERSDLEAKRDALLAQLREMKEVGGSEEEQRRLEKETAEVLRKIDSHSAAAPSAKRRPDSPVRPAVEGSRTGESDPRTSSVADIAAATRAATIRGFIWGALSVAILGGIAWFVSEKAAPRTDNMTGGGVPMASTAQQSSQQQQPDAALQQLQSAVAKSPDDLEMRSELAKAFLERENLMGVFEQTSYILKRSPNDARALTYQALVRVSMGQSDGAMEMLQRAIKSDPKLIDAYVALAWADMQRGKEKEAEALIDEAARQHPEQKAKLDEVFARMKEQIKSAPPAAMPANHPALPNPDGSQSAAAMAAAQTPAPAGGPSVHVTLTLDPSAKSSPTSVLYVIARAAGQTAGPPAAVKRVMSPNFPLQLDLSAADSMMGQPLPSSVRIEARLDSDGDAMTKNPSDPHAVQDGVATNGAKVGLVLK
ncbi:MAG: cytochrome c-type biosis protein CcmH [Thermoanaerobaculia bacterium]|jgi:cytochrome c-type biogenesis protein CcmH/NrfG|nr:cytochrome c-type biosis protein CcmH [Thermoanaerobaculia bacterium]